MGISDYKPIDNNAGTPAKWHNEDSPIGAAIANRLLNNTQWIAQNRLSKSSKVWDGTIANDETLGNFASRSLPSGLTGYEGYLGGGSLVSDPETIGVQFSTHPGLPMTIPFGWRLSPGARFLDVRVAMTVENANGGMAAFARLNGSTFPSVPIAEEIDELEYKPPANFTPSAGGFFNTLTRSDSDSYKEVAPTSASGTAGLSYYSFRIEIPGTLNGTDFQNTSYEEDNCKVFLAFQSGYDASSIGAETIHNGTDPSLSQGNRMLKSAVDMSKYANNTSPGKLHKVIKLNYSDVPMTETWHHVVQMRPSDPTVAPFDPSNQISYVLWPAVPPGGVPPSLTGGAGAGADESVGLHKGDSFSIYDLTKFTILSVTIEESFV